MKKLIILIAASLTLVACGENPRVEWLNEQSTIEVMAISSFYSETGEPPLAEYQLKINSNSFYSTIRLAENSFHVGDKLTLVEVNEYIKLKSFYEAFSKDRKDEK